jgi:ribonuclease HI
MPGFAVLHVDGGASGAPGPAAIGYLLQDEEGVRIAEYAEAIGTTSAAEAEYRALLAGLTRAYELGLRRVSARSDSRLLIAHVDGERNIRSPRLIELEADITDADAHRHRPVRVDSGRGERRGASTRGESAGIAPEVNPPPTAVALVSARAR